MRKSDEPAMVNRTLLTAIGGVAGLALWLFVEVLEDLISNARLYLFLFSATLGFFGAMLALVGPLPLRRAAASAAAVALPSAGLLTWAAGRFDSIGDFLGTGHPVFAFGVLMTLTLPYVACAQRPGEGWRAYHALFDQAWSIVVRYAAAWLFAGVGWAVVFLSDALFQLVGLDVIERLIEIDPVPYVLTGGLLGMAIAVVNELSDYVSPYLILRLLRLLLPVFLAVVAVFILALPFRGLSRLFGELSAAATLMAITLAAITLVTTAVAKNDADAARGRSMTGAMQLLGLMTPVVAGIALYAVWLRVDQYGWTPDRISAALGAAMLLAYAASYAAAILARGNWMGRIRRANTWLALCVIALAALFLTPVLNVQALSVSSQVGRFASGEVKAPRLDLWSIGREWGRAGEAGLERLAALEDENLAARLARLEDASTRYEFERAEDTAGSGPVREALLSGVEVFGPDGSRAERLPEGALDRISPAQLRLVSEACERNSPGGAPGCVAVAADLLPRAEGNEYLLAYLNRRNRVQVLAFVPVGAGSFRLLLRPIDMIAGGYREFDAGTIDAIRAGEMGVEPSGVNVLRLQDAEIFIQP